MFRPASAAPLAALLLTLTTSLACGGLMHQVQGADLAEMGAQISGLPDSPEKNQVLRMVEEAYLQVHLGNVGMIGLVAFQVAVEDAMVDGYLDSWEVTSIRKSAPFPTGAVPADTPARNALRRAFAAEMAAAGSRMSSDLRAWTQPGPLRSRIEQLGWTVDGCNAYDDDWIKEASCTIQRGTTAGYVTVSEFPDTEEARWATEDTWQGATKRDGRVVLSVQLSDGDAATLLRDAVLPVGARLGVIDDKALSARIRVAGWEPSDCSFSPDPSGSWTTCTVRKGGQQGSVDASTWRDAGYGGYGGYGGIPYRSTDAGIATASQNGEEIVVSIWDAKAAQALVDTMTGATSTP